MNPDPDADVTFQFNQIQLTDEDDADVTFGFNQANDDDDVEELPEKSPENEDSQQFTPEELPENDDVDNGDDDVTFNVNQVQTDSKSQQFTPENDDVANEDNDVTFGFSQTEVSARNDPENADVDDEGADVEGEGDDVEDEDADVDEEGDDVEGEEFTFMCINSDNEITELTEKTVFPLFDQTLLYTNEDGKRISVPVDNVFIESPRASRAETSSSSSSNTTLTAVTDLSEMNIKSNSTGFSKLWRFRDSNNINRSNSDGRDAFVFLNNPKTEGKTKGKVVSEGEGKLVVKKKVKKANVASAHEVYLKQKGGEEESKRKSYLPYRPGLMGFFTNVNGGLSKNVHPF